MPSAPSPSSVSQPESPRNHSNEISVTKQQAHYQHKQPTSTATVLDSLAACIFSTYGDTNIRIPAHYPLHGQSKRCLTTTLPSSSSSSWCLLSSGWLPSGHASQSNRSPLLWYRPSRPAPRVLSRRILERLVIPVRASHFVEYRRSSTTISGAEFGIHTPPAMTCIIPQG